MKVLITTVPFGEKDHLPIDLLEEAGLDFTINPLGKKLTEDELAEMVTEFDAIIAGTEPITDKVLSRAGNLKIISRVGIGLDSVDLISAEKRGIKVSYTPDAPSPAVAELTIGLMLSLLRSVQVSNMNMHNGDWHRYFGKRLSECTVGIIGIGRIGTGVLSLLSGFKCRQILVNDKRTDLNLDQYPNVEHKTKSEIYESSDVISLHLPLTAETYNMIQTVQIRSMKPDAVVINTSRGGIINEDSLYQEMMGGHLGGAAIDVFENEPYSGPLREIDRCLLTAHMGSMSVDCRTSMEIEATKEVIRFSKGQKLTGLVPEEEYLVQKESF